MSDAEMAQLNLFCREKTVARVEYHTPADSDLTITFTDGSFVTLGTLGGLDLRDFGGWPAARGGHEPGDGPGGVAVSYPDPNKQYVPDPVSVPENVIVAAVDPNVRRNEYIRFVYLQSLRIGDEFILNGDRGVVAYHHAPSRAAWCYVPVDNKTMFLLSGFTMVQLVTPRERLQAWPGEEDAADAPVVVAEVCPGQVWRHGKYTMTVRSVKDEGGIRFVVWDGVYATSYETEYGRFVKNLEGWELEHA